MSSQGVVLPYNPDANQDSVIGAPDLLEILPLFGNEFTPGEVLIDGENLTDYIAFLEEAASNATSDTITIPMMPGAEPGEMLFWNGEQWSLVPVGESGDALILSGETPTWKSLKLGCMDDSFLEFDPEATIADGSCQIPVIYGCTDSSYFEFNPSANVDDGSCAVSAVIDCGESVSYQGYDYSTVSIGGQCWFAENLRSLNYRNGDPIPAGLTSVLWLATDSGACGYYGEGDALCIFDFNPNFNPCWYPDISLAVYGRLYNWHAVEDERSLCPIGWHIPTHEEWDSLETTLIDLGWGGQEGVALRSTGGWYNGGNGMDAVGFSGEAGGARADSQEFFSSGGEYTLSGSMGFWWSSTMLNGSAWYQYLVAGDPGFYSSLGSVRNGFSIRCIQ